ncbi:MAG: protein arginine phosphatase [Actinomycetota bacterium]
MTDASVVFVCTGNAARSVMAGAVLSHMGWARVVTAGTMVIEGMPMSWRTRDALKELGVTVPAHRSRQLTAADAHDADLIVCFETFHVAYVRREHPEAAYKTATIRRLVRDLPRVNGDVRALNLAEVELEDWENVEDPAGGDLDVVVACAKEVAAMVDQLAALL